MTALEVEADRSAVIRLMAQYIQGLDALDEALLARTFVKDAVAEYVGANFDMDVHLEGIEAILAWIRENFGSREDAVPWHYVDTHVVEVEGDTATLRSYLHNRHMSSIGLYTVNARRTPQGWGIAKLHLEGRILDPELFAKWG
ncbi:MAG: nuclear transport factor 2 family protein [Acidimicrobiia bacterium]